MILSCNVWCSDNDENRDLGLPDGDCWMPISINLKFVETIKEAGENGFLGKGKATIYIANEHFIIDVDYTNAVEMWKNSLKTEQYIYD